MSKIADQEYRVVGIHTLTPHPANPNHGNVSEIAKSIKEVDFYGAIIVRASDSMIIAGEHRWRAALAEGLTEVPVIMVNIEERDTARALKMLTGDNRLAELARRNDAELAKILNELKSLDEELGLVGTGYDDDFLADLNAALATPLVVSPVDEPEEEVTEIEAERLREKWGTEIGQVWVIPSSHAGIVHRITCSDARVGLEALAPGESLPALGFHDPPYGTNISFGSGLMGGGKYDVGEATQRRYLPVAGDDEPFDPRHLLSTGEVVVIWGANYFAEHLPPRACWISWDKKAGLELKHTIFAECELAWTSTNKPARMIRHRWHGFVRDSEHGQTRLHPTQKPIAVQREVIELFTSPGDTVLDLYGGSGSTLLACEESGRRCIINDLEPGYVAVMLERMTRLGLTPTQER